MKRFALSMLSVLGIGVLAMTAATPAHALSGLTGFYYTISHSNPDVQGGIDGGTVTGLVTDTLGPNGQPVVSAFGATYGGGSGPITDFNAGTGEIQWWTPTGSNGVTLEKTQTDALPLNHDANFFADSQTDNSTDYRAVHWTGTFVAPSSGTINLFLTADDDAFAYVDGKLVLDNGGVKALNLSTPESEIDGLSAGTHTFDLFFADRHEVQAGIDFRADVNFTPAVPEPGALSLLIAPAIVGAGFLRRRMARKA